MRNFTYNKTIKILNINLIFNYSIIKFFEQLMF